jgi:hypothetical protein
LNPEETASDPDETASDPDETASHPDETASHPDETASQPEEASSNPNQVSPNPQEPPSEILESHTHEGAVPTSMTASSLFENLFTYGTDWPGPMESSAEGDSQVLVEGMKVDLVSRPAGWRTKIQLFTSSFVLGRQLCFG